MTQKTVNLTVAGATHHLTFQGRSAAEAHNPINFRLLKWGLWYRDRRDRTLPPDIEAVEKAVGHLPDHDDPKLKTVVTMFYLRSLSTAQIAEAIDDSEYHCEEYLARAIRRLSRDIHAWDANLRQQRTRRHSGC